MNGKQMNIIEITDKSISYFKRWKHNAILKMWEFTNISVGLLISFVNFENRTNQSVYAFSQNYTVALTEIFSVVTSKVMSLLLSQ